MELQPDDVRARCRELIQVVGKNGGFIFDGAPSGVPDDAPLAKVAAMMRVAREFGNCQQDTDTEQADSPSTPDAPLRLLILPRSSCVDSDISK